MSKPILTYFPIGGLAHASRIAFTIGGVDFEDRRLTFDEWQAKKASNESNTPLGQLPTLEVNGNVYCQSKSILRYSGKLTGLYPTDPLEALLVDQVMETQTEAQSALFASVSHLTDPAEKTAAVNKFINSDWLKFVKALDKWVGDKDSFTGKLSIADVQVYAGYDFLTSGFSKFLDIDAIKAAYATHAPNLNRAIHATAANPKVAAYVASQKQ